MRKRWVVNAAFNLENLKAIHNAAAADIDAVIVVNAAFNLENLKAIHNRHTGKD